jgi:hypothetical protein
VIYELRTYETFNHNKKAFHDRFEEHAMRIMKKYGFEIVGCWDEEIGEMQNFSYILAWKDLNTRQAAWSNFNSDEEWSNIKLESFKKHGQLVFKTHNKILKPTKYSPLQ